MAQHSFGWHHFYKHKRQNKKKLKPYPNRKVKRFVDRAIFIIAVVSPAMASLQLFKIWIGKNAAGVSLPTWATFIVTSSFWLSYGILHKQKPIIISNVAWVFITVGIVLGTLLYG